MLHASDASSLYSANGEITRDSASEGVREYVGSVRKGVSFRYHRHTARHGI